MLASVLIIDDQKEIVDLLELFICEKFKGVFVAKAFDFEDAMAYLNQQVSFDLIICDYNLRDGQKSGLDILLYSRQQFNIPFILLTGGFCDDHVVSFLSSYQDEKFSLLEKPIDEKLLEENIVHMTS